MTIVVHQLVHRYGEVEALRGISAEVSPGKITAILGPNAAGKSTLLRCIIGAIKPTSGAVLMDGKPAHSMSAYHLAQRVAYVPQRSVVSASFTVREVVELGRYSLTTDRAVVDEAIERLELSDIQDRPYPALSVGQQQRVTLARALAQLGNVQTSKRPNVQTSKESETSKPPNLQASERSIVQRDPNPPRSGESFGRLDVSTFRRFLLVLDEPMSAMDLRHVRDCARLLRDVADSGVAVLIAMHDLALAARMSDEAWLLNEGRLAARGDAREVLVPERLAEVFGVDFTWATRSDGAQVLSASV